MHNAAIEGAQSEPLARYIHLNPVRAGLSKNVADYKWSSHHAYMGEVTIPWLRRQDILARFSSDECKAGKLFWDFTCQGMGEPKRMDFHNGSHLGQLLGDGHVAERALSMVESKPLREKAEKIAAAIKTPKW